MTRDDIIRMARDAGFHVKDDDYGNPMLVTDSGDLTKLAQLVAAHEREECARLSDMLGEMLAKDHPMHARVALTIGIKIRART